MNIHKSVEQGAYVILMLAFEQDHKPVKSSVLSKILNVSDSYLKKILRKFVVADLIKSNASKDGGFKLIKQLDEITVYDVYHALKTKDVSFKFSKLAYQIFEDKEKILNCEKKVISVFHNAYKSFENELKKVKLSDLISNKDNYIKGFINWNNVYQINE